MRAILLTLSLFVLCASNATFLRELADIATIDKFTFECNKGLTLPASFKAKTTADGTPASTSIGAVTLHLDGVAAYGTYKVTAMVDKSDETKKYVISSAKGNSWEFVELFELDATQTTAQTVDSKSDDKKTFKVALKAAVTAVPKFYTNSTDTGKEIPCALDTEKKNVICTPTTTQMDAGSKYTVQYKKPCEPAFTTTGITVEFSESYFMTVTNILLVLAILF